MKKVVRILNNRSGFSLIETMIAVGISAVLSLAISQSIASSIEGASQVKSARLVDDVSDILSGILVDSSYCGLLFNGTNLNPSINNMNTPFATRVTFREMTNSSAMTNRVLFGAGTVYQNTVRINSIDAFLTNKIAPTRYLGELRVDMVSSTGIMRSFMRYITIFVDVDATNRITSCGQSASMANLSRMYVPGQAYGYCKMDLGPSFIITNSSGFKYPFLDCPNSGALRAPRCASGFSPVVSMQMQANSSSSGDFLGGSTDPRVIMGRYADADVYNIGWQCVKD